MLLDDVHFADASSWQALRYFARHLDDARLLVLATSRPAELAGHDVAAQVLFELDQDALLSRLEVAPLARPGLRELTEAVIERPAPRALVDWVAERSQGNPLFAIGLLRALMDERGDFSAPNLRRLPEGLTERVVSEFAGSTRRRAGCSSGWRWWGGPVSLGDLTTLTSSSLEEIGPMLAELVRAGVVVEEERGSELDYELYHPLVRDVIYQATSGATRRVLHRQSARSLLRAGHLAEAALHFARSAERGDSEAVEVLLDAMRQAERREAFREALDLQAELVELLPADDQRWLEVLEAMYARAEWLIDHRAETNAPVAITALRAIDGLLEGSSDHARRAIVKFRLANFLAWGTGDLEPAHDACRQAHDLFSRAGERRQALLARRELAWIRGLQGDLAGMGADARAVVEAADAVDDRFVAMQGLAAVGYSARFRGAFAEAEAAQRRAAAIARQDEKAYRLTDGTRRAGARACTAGARRRDRRAARGGEGRESGLPRQHPGRAGDDRELDRRRFHRRAGSGARGGRLAGGGHDPAAGDRDGIGRGGGGRVRRRRRGGASVRAGARGLRRAGLVVLPARDAVGGGGARVARGSRGRVRRGLQHVAGRLVGHGGPGVGRVGAVRPGRGRGGCRGRGAAEAAAEQLRAVAEFTALPLYGGLAAAASAWASVGDGAGERAGDSARRAIALLSTTGCAAFLARAHHVLGRSLPADGRAEAVVAFETAAAMFEQAGSSWRRQRSLDALRRLGSAGRRAAAAALGPDSLTRREREVARLAATGMSAKEIAGLLFVGERTVESHLASVYAKLGVHSKLQLVRRATELGLA